MSLIEMQTQRRKRIWLKVISFFVAFIFLFQQLGIADVYDYKRLSGVAEELLPTSEEYDQSNRYDPAHLKRQQRKHEDIIRQRMGKEELIGQLERAPRAAIEDMPLKKKRPGGGGNIDYTLTEPDDINDPHLYNDLQHEGEALSQIDTFDITRYPPIDVDLWKNNAEKKEDEDTGLDYWVGYEGLDGPPEERKIKEVIYFGDAENEKIEKMFSGYCLNPANGEYEAKYRTEYEYSGDSISKTLKYYIWGGADILIEEATYEGDEDNNRIVQLLVFSKITGDIKRRQDFVYEDDGDDKVLREIREYDTEGLSDADARTEGLGDLKSITYFVGEKDKTVADYTVTYKDGDITTTVINYYDGDRRAEELGSKEYGYREPKERTVTYRGEVDVDAEDLLDADGNPNPDGILDGYENQVISISHYHNEHRLPGEEVLDYTQTYSGGRIVQTTVYFYGEAEVSASDANYRAPMKKSVSYWGDALDEDGNVRDDAREKSITYYFIEGRLKGEETADYTINRTSRGVIISTMIYYYEGDKRASESEIDDRMSVNVTYRGVVDETANTILITDIHGNEILVLEGYESQLASITYFDYENREKGDEVSDYTVKYNRSLRIISTTVYLYEADLKRAKDAEADDRMDRSVTYRGDVDTEAEDLLDADGNPNPDGLLDGYEDQLDSITYYFYDGRLKGEETSDYTEKYNTRQEIVTMTVYLYEAELKRADETEVYDRMSRSVTYRGVVDPEAEDLDGDGLLDGYEDQLRSITYYDFEDRVKGEEISDYTENYNSRGEISSMTFYYYEDGMRAEEAGASDRMSKSVTYRGEVDPEAEDLDGDGLLDGYEDQLVSITYYDYIDRLKGEEVADYTENFNADQEVKTTTVYLYESDLKRAIAADPDDRMSRSVTYYGALADPQSIDSEPDGVIDAYADKLSSVTFYHYEPRLKGEEIADYTYNYKLSDPSIVKSVSVFYYHDGQIRAEFADPYDEMTRSDSYRAGSIFEVNRDVVDAVMDNILSETFYFGEKGEEVADYSYNYRYGNASQIKSTSVMYYEPRGTQTGDQRAEDADYQAAAMVKSESYRSQVDTTAAGLPGEIASRMSTTYFFGVKGDEIADYSHNYKFFGTGSGTEIKTTSVMYYAELAGTTATGNRLRAEDLDANELMRAPMVRSESYRGDVDATVAGLPAEIAERMSTTYFIGEKGDELADYSHNYKLFGAGAGTDVKTTSVMYYAELDDVTFAETGNALRAEQLDGYEQLLGRMLESESYRGAVDTDVADLPGEIEKRMSTTYFVGEKGDEIADYSHNYKLFGAGGGTAVKTTSVMYYAELDGAGVETGVMLRAAALDADELIAARMVKSESYRREVDTAIAALPGEIASRMSTTYFIGTKGDEIADYSHNYKLFGTGAGTAIKTTSVMYYAELDDVTADETGAMLRAEELDAAEQLRGRMVKSESYRQEVNTALAALPGEIADRMSTTYFLGAKGDEVADYSHNYKLFGVGAGVAVKTTSVMYYAELNDSTEAETGAILRAEQMDAGEQMAARMVQSESYRGELDTSLAVLPGLIANRMSTTYFVGSKGDEIADYSHNYKLFGEGAGIAVKTTSVMYYAELDDVTEAETGLELRAEELDEDEQIAARMVKSESYRGDVDTDVALLPGEEVNRMSTTYFVGTKGDEIADYSHNYKLFDAGAGTVVKTTSVMYYAELDGADNEIGVIRAAELDDANEQIMSRMLQSESYRGMVDTALAALPGEIANRMSTTYFEGTKGDEIADYSHNYKLFGTGKGTAIKTTSVMYYAELHDVTGEEMGTVIRAENLDADEFIKSRMMESVSYRGEVDTEIANMPAEEENRMSTTYFVGTKGDEIADYSHNYKLFGDGAGTAVKTTSVMYYAELSGEAETGNALRAEELDANEQLRARMVQSESYRGEVDTDLGVLPTLESSRMSTTYFVGSKGDEIADYSHNYKLFGVGAGSDIKTTSVMYYAELDDITENETGETRRAEELDADEQIAARMVKSESYRGEVDTDVADLPAEEPSRMSTTYFIGTKGDEIADYSHNYKLFGIGAGTVIKTTSVMYYAELDGADNETGNAVRAEELDDANEQIMSRMVKSESYRKEVDTALVALPGEIASRMSTTYFVGSKGDEIADYSHNYKLFGTGKGTAVKTTSVMYYAELFASGTETGAELRAEDLDANEQLRARMIKSESYRMEVDTDPTQLPTEVAERMSTTYFLGDKGDEIADYSHNYKLFGDGAGTAVKTTSVMYYAELVGDTNVETGNALRAGELNAHETVVARMVQSESYRGEVDTDLGVLPTLESSRMSTTYFVGTKGDEIADYSHNYKLFGAGAGVEVKTTSVMYYAELLAGVETGEELRAEVLDEDEQIEARMVKSESYRGEVDTDVADLPAEEVSRMSTTYFIGTKGDEIADYSHNYKLFGVGAGSTIKTTSVMYYAQLDGANNEIGVVRAVELDDANEQLMSRMVQSESYRKEVDTALAALPGEIEKRMSTTYFVGSKGDEVADYSHNYKLFGDNKGTEIKTTSVMYYSELDDTTGLETGAVLRAEVLDADEQLRGRMVQSESYREEVDTDLGDLPTEIAKRMSTTYFLGTKGDEVADHSHNYKFFGDGAGTAIKTTSVMYYAELSGETETGNALRAEELDSNEQLRARMVQSESYRGEVDADLMVLPGEIASRMSTTYFVGTKGDEVADYSHNYKLFDVGAGVEIKTTSVMYYAELSGGTETGGALRAEVLDEDEQIEARMVKSESYRGGNINIDNLSANIADRMSTTHFVGIKGEEIADYSHNYKLFGAGAGTVIKTTSVMYYAELDGADNETGNALRAEELNDANEQLMSRMVQSESYRKEVDTALAALPGEIEKRMSTTYFLGSKGDEIADYSHNYKLFGANRGTEIKTTSVMYYAELDDVTDTETGNALRAEVLDADEQLKGRMVESESYRREVDTDLADLPGEIDKRMSTTYFLGSKGDEVADYSRNYKLFGDGAGITVKTTSVMYYSELLGEAETGNALRAKELDSNEQLRARMIQSESYRKEVDTDLAALPGEIAKRMSTTYFLGSKGDEIADYSHNYKLFGVGAGVEVKTTSVMYYAELDDVTGNEVAGTRRRAVELDEDEQIAARMVESESYRKAVDTDLADLPGEIAKRMSTTYFIGVKGEEIADYSHNYKLFDVGAGITVKTTSVMYYAELDDVTSAEVAGSRKRAVELDGDEQIAARMVQSESYRKEVDTDIAALPGEIEKRMSTTYFLGSKGDEIADYSHNYKLFGANRGTEIKTTSVMYYVELSGGMETGNALRAEELDEDEQVESRMIASESYRKEVDTDLADLPGEIAKRMSTTYFIGDKGGEVADYSHNYKLFGIGAGITVKTTSVMYYAELDDVTGNEIAGSRKRAVEMDADEQTAARMVQSESYRKEVDTDIADLPGEISNRMSTTYFLGNKGDEIADYSHNYKLFGANKGIEIKTTSVMFYAELSGGAETGNVLRAEELDEDEQIEARMVESESYRKAVDTDLADLPGEIAKRMSTTYFVGVKGEEIADYSHNYKLFDVGAGITVKTTSVMYYAELDDVTGNEITGSRKRAAELDGDEQIAARMVQSESYRKEVDTNLAALPSEIEKRMSTTYFLGSKGDEIADYSHNYKLFGTNRGTEIKTTSVMYYAELSGDTETGNALRAEELDEDEQVESRMIESESYRKEVDTDLADLPGEIAKRMSTTYFIGDKGGEVADYSHNYKLFGIGAGITVKSTSVMYYAELDDVTGNEITGSRKRAAEMDADEQTAARMVQSESYRKEVDTDIADLPGEISNRMSTTYFLGSKGDEIADYSHNYKLFGANKGTEIKTTSVMYYAELDDVTGNEIAGSRRRAEELDEDEQIAARMVQSESYRKEVDTDLPDLPGEIAKRLSTTYFVGVKGE